MHDQFFNILNSFSRPFLLVDEKGDILQSNSGFKEIIQYTDTEGFNICQLASQEGVYADKLTSFWAKLKSGTSFSHPLMLLTSDGGQIQVELEAAPYLKDQKGRYTYLLLFEVVKNEVGEKQDLAKLVSLLNKTQKISRTGGWELNVKTGHTLWTKGVYQIHDVPLNFDHNKENGIKFYHPDDISILLNALERAISEKIPFDIKCRFYTSKRKLLYVRVTGHPVTKEDEVTHVIGVIQDITQQHETEEGLKTLKDRFQLATRAANMGVWDYYPQKNELHWDEAMYRLYGKKKEDFSGAYDAWSSTLHPDSLEKAQKELEMALRGEKDFNTEFEIVLPDGERRIIAGEAAVKRNQQGEAVRMIGVNYDITARKMAEAEMIRAREEAEKASKAKSDFLSTMSHEIRTPLNAVIGVSGLLDETKLEEEQKDLVKTIRQGGESLLSIINDILDFSKIEAGKIELEQEEFQLITPVEDVIDLLSNQALGKGIDLHFSADKNSSAYYLGDAGRIRQILVNLLGNAIKFTLEGEVILKLRQIEDKDDQAVFEFAIQDTGIGIAQEKMDRLFKSFSQVDASTTRKFGGSGLGLAITQKLIQLLGGDIWVESELGEGTTFFFTISIEKAKHQPSIAAGKKENRELDLSNTSILLVEDNTINQKVGQKMLRKFNANVEIACNGKEAVEYVCMRSFDLVFMDMQMPVMDGLEATRRIREMKDNIHQPIILAMTANSAIEDKQKCMQAGMDDFISKPITLEMIKGILIKWQKSQAGGNI